jgi:carbon-monoxide dehydrogenase small subunit
MNVMFEINGTEKSVDVEPRTLVVDLIRTKLGMTGTHIGCDTSNCGACTVLLDGRPVKSCTLLAPMLEGRKVTTVEGLAIGGKLDSIQVGFHEEHGLQCGFCTPGMMLVGKALIDANPHPTEDEIRWGISGNICRCTGYMNIVKAIQHAAAANAAENTAGVA